MKFKGKAETLALLRKRFSKNVPMLKMIFTTNEF